MRPQHHEKRKNSRHPMRRAAEVFFGLQKSPVRCVIWDMSDGGARLAVACPLADLPRIFTLSLFNNVQRKCEIVWSDTRYVGVKFI